MAAVTRADETIAAFVEQILVQSPLKAAGFIVTIYGDVVEPRGGVAWIGNLIETCAEVGISETLVRTAVSRLVASGQLSGEREGRRSYYRLSPSAGDEFAAAARVLFGEQQDNSWQFVHVTGPAPEDTMLALDRAGYARIGARLAVGPTRPLAMPATLVFKADATQDGPALRDFAAEHWDLDRHASAYRAFIAQFMPIADHADAHALAPKTALTVRLLLIHRFRSVLLHDPRLPALALPTDWPGKAARQLFARLYQQLSPHADEYVTRSFVTASGPFAPLTRATDLRLAMLAREVL